MSRIDDLITEHCPSGVDFVEIGKLVERASSIKWGNQDEEEFEYIDLSSVDRRTNRIVETTTVDRTTAPSRAQQVVRKGDVLFGTTRPTLSRYCVVAANYDGQIATTGFCVLRPGSRLSEDWLYHLMGTPAFYKYVEKNQRGASYPAISSALVKDFRIPVPPLSIQREIAKILGRMEELEARARQYAHYRDSLLAFADNAHVRWATFGDVATIVRGGSPRPIRAFVTDTEDGVNWIKIGDVVAGEKYITKTAEKIKPEGARKSRRVKPGDFVLSNSMSFGRPYIMKIDGCIHDGWLAIKDFDSTFVPDFLYHLLRSTPVYREMASKAGAGTVQNLNADIVKALLLPAPDLAEQQRIVSVLDKFDALVNDLSVGLPAEMKARRQQYEYYRDRLLTFRERAA